MTGVETESQGRPGKADSISSQTPSRVLSARWPKAALVIAGNADLEPGARRIVPVVDGLEIGRVASPD
jgi:hypothetical protein